MLTATIILFAFALIWTLIATIQDLKKREVANWLNFSLLATALAFRAFYALQTDDIHFFTLGLANTLLCTALAYALYYGKVFAGGDAKLLIALGAVLPVTSYKTFIPETFLFVFILFLVGALYSLFYSIYIVTKNSERFKKEFYRKCQDILKKNTLQNVAIKVFLTIGIPLGIIFLVFPVTQVISSLIGFGILSIVLLTYTQSLEPCMLKTVPPNKLTEGDWIPDDIYINKTTVIKKTVHGLSQEDIHKLRKARKSITIKEGIPFVPAFFLTLLLMGYVVIIAQHSLLDLLLKLMALS